MGGGGREEKQQLNIIEINKRAMKNETIELKPTYMPQYDTKSVIKTR